MSDKDLMLLLANPKKLQRSGSSTSVITQSTTLQPVREAFQILESKCGKEPTIQEYPKEFADFIIRNIPEIIKAFNRSISR